MEERPDMDPDEFSGAAHEFNNLLQLIALRISQVSSTLPEDGPLRKSFKDIEDDLWRAIPMLRNLLLNGNGGNEQMVPIGQFVPSLRESAIKFPVTATREARSETRPVLLYVDDNPDRLALLKPILELNGYYVLTAQDGKKGLELFLSEPVELVVLDYFMPTMKGDEVAQKMRKLRPNVPIVMFSGALTLPEIVIAMIDGFVSTSEEPGALLEKIGSLLQESAHARAS